MRAQILKCTIVFTLFLFAGISFAKTITLEKVSVQVKPVSDGTFNLLFSFDLPQLPNKVNIDYAVLSFGLNIAGQPDSRALEILSGSTSSQGKTADYNANPVKGWLPKNKTGLALVELDVTQLVELWLKGEKNEGISVISHRRTADRALETGNVVLAPGFKKATVKIYYTEIK